MGTLAMAHAAKYGLFDCFDSCDGVCDSLLVELKNLQPKNLSVEEMQAADECEELIFKAKKLISDACTLAEQALSKMP